MYSERTIVSYGAGYTCIELHVCNSIVFSISWERGGREKARKKTPTTKMWKILAKCSATPSKSPWKTANEIWQHIGWVDRVVCEMRVWAARKLLSSSPSHMHTHWHTLYSIKLKSFVKLCKPKMGWAQLCFFRARLIAKKAHTKRGYNID